MIFIGILVGVYVSVGVRVGWEEYQSNGYSDYRFDVVPEGLYSLLLAVGWLPLVIYFIVRGR